VTFTRLTDRILFSKPAGILNLYLPCSDVRNKDKQVLADRSHTMEVYGGIRGCACTLTSAGVHTAYVWHSPSSRLDMMLSVARTEFLTTSHESVSSC